MSKFDIALYKYDGKLEMISVNQITYETYNSKYRERLFCPNKRCTARLLFVEWKKSQTVFFRTWNGDNHIEGCNYSVIYDEENFHKRNYEYVNLNISDEHIKKRLESAYNSLIDTEHKVKKPNGDHLVKEIVETISQDDDSVGGRASLFGDGIDNDSGREPRIEKRLCDLLSDDDIGQVRCIIGEIHSIHINEDHAYMNLTPMQFEAVSIYLNPSFKSEFSGMFEGLEFLNNYIEHRKKRNKKVNICCVGLVELKQNDKVTWKYQISVDRAIALSFNGKSYYELITENTFSK